MFRTSVTTKYCGLSKRYFESSISPYLLIIVLRQDALGRCLQFEYDEGYIVFRRYRGYDVWRRRIDVLDIPGEARPSGGHNKPDEDMIEDNRFAEKWYLDASRSRDPSHLRGQFIPWARLRVPEATNAFKLTRGTLLVSSNRKAFLYDIEKAELQQVIGVDEHIDYLRHVDLSDQHIFIVRTLQLSVYDRVTGLSVLSIPAGRQSWDFYASLENQRGCTEHTVNHGELSLQQVVCPDRSDRDDCFRGGGYSTAPTVVPVQCSDFSMYSSRFLLWKAVGGLDVEL